MDNTERKRRTGFWRRAITVFIMAALVVVIFILTYRNNELKKQRDELLAQKHDSDMREEQLQQRFDAPVDEEYMEKAAREQGYSGQNEVIFYNDLPQS